MFLFHNNNVQCKVQFNHKSLEKSALNINVSIYYYNKEAVCILKPSVLCNAIYHYNENTKQFL